MKKALILTAIIPILAGGCAMDRLVEVNTTRIEVGSSQTNGLTTASAVAIFRDVANRLGFVIKGPFQDPRTPDESGFSAWAAETRPKNKSNFAMSIEHNQISFVCRIYGSKEDFIDAQMAATLVEQELDKRGIQYKVSTRKGLYP